MWRVRPYYGVYVKDPFVVSLESCACQGSSPHDFITDTDILRVRLSEIMTNLLFGRGESENNLWTRDHLE
jgi:hypothetical protein